tara:strand:- start:49 stop:222 length:174 start_codon:yes stop_codon:yes gene_type:complete
MKIALRADNMSDLTDLIVALSERLDDPDRIAAVRVDETMFRAELDLAARPVDPRRLH